MKARPGRAFLLRKEVSLKNLQEATERICELKGSQIAFDALVPAVIDALSASSLRRLIESFDAHAEAARTVMLHTDISDLVLASFERDIARNRTLLQRSVELATRATSRRSIEALLLTATRITSFAQSNALTSATGFFFRRGDRLFLVSNRHVFSDAASSHFPDRIEIRLHTDIQDLTGQVELSLALYRDGIPQWRTAGDDGGAADVAALEIPAARLPAGAALQAFDETHLDPRDEEVAIGDPLTIVGFSLDLHDAIHHLPVALGAFVASAHGTPFQGRNCFLTDTRTLLGSGGSPVVRRRSCDGPAATSPSWQLLGVHSTSTDIRTGSQARGQASGLNCAWYAHVLLQLTAAD